MHSVCVCVCVCPCPCPGISQMPVHTVMFKLLQISPRDHLCHLRHFPIVERDYHSQHTAWCGCHLMCVREKHRHWEILMDECIHQCQREHSYYRTRLQRHVSVPPRRRSLYTKSAVIDKGVEIWESGMIYSKNGVIYFHVSQRSPLWKRGGSWNLLHPWQVWLCNHGSALLACAEKPRGTFS